VTFLAEFRPLSNNAGTLPQSKVITAWGCKCNMYKQL